MVHDRVSSRRGLLAPPVWNLPLLGRPAHRAFLPLSRQNRRRLHPVLDVRAQHPPQEHQPVALLQRDRLIVRREQLGVTGAPHDTDGDAPFPARLQHQRANHAVDQRGVQRQVLVRGDGDNLRRVFGLLKEVLNRGLYEGIREGLHQRPGAHSLAVDKVGLGANLSDALGREREPRGHVLVVFTDDVHRNALALDGPELTKQEQDVENAGVPVVRAQPHAGLRPEDDRGVNRGRVDHRREDGRGRRVARDVPQPHALVFVTLRVPVDGDGV